MININSSHFNPKFKIGQEVFVIIHDHTCPAVNSINDRYVKTKISEYYSKVIKSGNMFVLLMDRYGTETFNMHYGNSSYAEEDVYETEEEVLKSCEWKEVNLSEELWGQLCGEAISYISEQEKNSDWLNLIYNCDIALEDSDLGNCCEITANIRGLLIKCSKNGGLIAADITKLKDLINNHTWGEDLINKDSSFSKVLNQLGLVLTKDGL